jgi:hypothetical protein
MQSRVPEKREGRRMTDFRYTPFTVKKIRRHAQTMKPATIAAFMRCDVSMVEHICRKHEIPMHARDGGGVEAPREPVRKAIEIEIEIAMLRVVKQQARERGLDSLTLIERLIERIAADGLFNAVLDR